MEKKQNQSRKKNLNQQNLTNQFQNGKSLKVSKKMKLNQ